MGYSTYFVTKQRNNGGEYVALTDESPAWLLEAVREAHQGTLPNDWIFAECQAAVEACDKGDINEGELYDYVNGRTEVYTRDLFLWAADMCVSDIWALAEESANEIGMPDSTIDRIAAIQAEAIRYIAEIMVKACEAHECENSEDDHA